MLEKSKYYVYLSWLLVFVFGHFLDCLVHEELWEDSSDPRPLLCGLDMDANHNLMYI